MKIAIVTGASSGIGREFVKQAGHFYRTLDEVWVIARRGHRLQELNVLSTVPVRILEGDLLHEAVYEQLGTMLEKEKPDIRMLVNAAGYGKSGPVEEILSEDKRAQLEMIDLNCRALSRITFECLPYLSKGSRILNMASAAAFCPQPLFSVYAATKAYVLSFSRSLGAELRNRGIYVTAVCPGPVDTEFFRVSGELENPLKKLTKVKAPGVVKKALQDSRAGKDISIYGFPLKGAHIASKLLPHHFLLNLMMVFNPNDIQRCAASKLVE